MRRWVFFSTLFFAIVMLSSCAKEPSTAEKMRSYAGEVQATADRKTELAEQWETGDKMLNKGEERINDGEDLIKDAKKDLEKGRKLVSRGEDEVKEGRRLMIDAERKFQQEFPDLTLEAEKK